jgi:predicted double-glycine peptidase
VLLAVKIAGKDLETMGLAARGSERAQMNTEKNLPVCAYLPGEEKGLLSGSHSNSLWRGPIALALVAAISVYADNPAWLDVPYVRQTESTDCGAAALAMVMQYWSRQKPLADPAAAEESRIYSALAPGAKEGIRGNALKGYLEDHGFRAFVFNGELSDLRTHIGKGRPLVVCLKPGGASPELHYVVVVGIGNSAVYFHDPARGKLSREDLQRFQREWKSTDAWTLLALPGANE